MGNGFIVYKHIFYNEFSNFKTSISSPIKTSQKNAFCITLLIPLFSVCVKNMKLSDIISNFWSVKNASFQYLVSIVLVLFLWKMNYHILFFLPIRSFFYLALCHCSYISIDTTKQISICQVVLCVGFSTSGNIYPWPY